MNLKISRIISVIGITILTFISHYVYEWLPTPITSIFFPVNESIWEHMKMIFTSIIFYSLIDYIILKKLKINFNNFFSSILISSISAILIFLIIYLPLYYKIGPKMYLNIIVMIISIIISQIISYYILKAENCKKGNIISFFGIILCYIILGYLTYKPIKNKIFFDVIEEKYGINNYNI